MEGDDAFGGGFGELFGGAGVEQGGAVGVFLRRGDGVVRLGPNSVHPAAKSGELPRTDRYVMAPGCAGQEYSFLSFGLRKPDWLEVSSAIPKPASPEH